MAYNYSDSNGLGLRSLQKTLAQLQTSAASSAAPATDRRSNESNLFGQRRALLPNPVSGYGGYLNQGNPHTQRHDDHGSSRDSNYHRGGNNLRAGNNPRGGNNSRPEGPMRGRHHDGNMPNQHQYSPNIQGFHSQPEISSNFNGSPYNQRHDNQGPPPRGGNNPRGRNNQGPRGPMRGGSHHGSMSNLHQPSLSNQGFHTRGSLSSLQQAGGARAKQYHHGSHSNLNSPSPFRPADNYDSDDSQTSVGSDNSFRGRGRGRVGRGSSRGVPRSRNSKPQTEYPSDGNSRGAANNRGNRGGRGGRGNYGDRGDKTNRHKPSDGRENEEYNFTFLRNLAEKHDAFDCLMKCTKPGFGVTLENAKDKDTDKIDLLLKVVQKAFTGNSPEHTQVLATCLLESQSDFLHQKCLQRFLPDLSGSTSAVKIVNLEQSLEAYLDVCETLMGIDWKLGSRFETPMLTLKLLLRSTHHAIADYIKVKYDVATDSLQQKKDEAEKRERIEREENRMVDRGLSIASSQDDPSAFRNDPPHPTKAMVKRKFVKLRKNYETGEFASDDDYLDVQFRLLQEDLMNSLRIGVQDMKQYGRMEESDARLYENLTVLAPKPGRGGITYTIGLDRSNKKFKFIAMKLSRRLMFGSLLLLSTDRFHKVFVFATIAENDDIKDGKFEVTVVPQSEEDWEKHITAGTRVDAIESAAYYEAYVHVLKAMQEIKEVPFSRYIVRLRPLIHPPSYLKKIREYTMFNSEGNPTRQNAQLNYGVFPTEDELGMNTSQREAFALALTREFAIIQGPPGTGKTFIGTKVAQVLLHNLYGKNQCGDSDSDSDSDTEVNYRINEFGVPEAVPKRETKTENKKPINSPMLVVCFTNHALDQFLEGVLQFCDLDDVVRIGSKSQSEKMLQCHIRKKRAPRGFGRDIRDIQDKLDNLSRKGDFSSASKWIERADTKIVYRHFFNLDPYFVDQFDRMADSLSLQGEERDLILYYWLGCEACILKRARFDMLPKLISVRLTDDILVDPCEDEEDSDDDNKLVDIEYDDDRMLDDQDYMSPNAVRYSAAADSLIQYDADARFSKEITKAEKKTAERRLRDELAKKIILNDDQESMIIQSRVAVNDLLNFPFDLRWHLYRKWLKTYKDRLIQSIVNEKKEYNSLHNQLKAIRRQQDKSIMEQCKVLGMTTTAAARYHDILEEIGCEIVIIEEAAEVLEAHVVAALSKRCKHLILIGDHQQLRPNPNVFHLAKNFHLDLSLFERMVKNKVEHKTLGKQHRMRPEVSQFIRFIYPTLKDNESVLKGEHRKPIRGAAKPVYFIDHNESEDVSTGTRSKQNEYEADFIVELCRYLMRQEYQASEITIITMYVGQLLLIRRKMPKTEFNGVKITSVDNFQGEENHIILLSLVRSNQKSNLGFVAIENRICVAMSRAKYGMYVIGNMTMMESNSDLWAKIIELAKRQGLLGYGFPISCYRHGTGAVVDNPADFKKKAPLGGCTRVCGGLLGCGHACPQRCHQMDRGHKQYKCQQPCPKTLACGHSCPSKCYGDCSKVKCNIDVTMTLDCGHTQKVKCHQEQNGVQVPCTSKVPHYCITCMKTMSVACSEQYDPKCDTPCQKSLPCGHKCTGTCYTCIDNCPTCNAQCDKKMACGHECRNTKCCQATQPDGSCLPCTAPCVMQCAHNSRCTVKCFDHDKKKCHIRCPMKKCGRSSCKRGHSANCGSKCHEPCTFLPCTKPCENTTQCPKCMKEEAVCISVCGERCLLKCPTCDLDELMGYHDQYGGESLILQLRHCDHKWELKQLMTILKQANELQKTNGDRVVPRCPKFDCGAVIVENRFWNFCF